MKMENKEVKIDLKTELFCLVKKKKDINDRIVLIIY